jgi:hypothetical protein
VIFPSVGHPRKFWSAQILDEFQRELECKVAQSDSAGEIYPPEKCPRNKLSSPCHQPGHKKAPENRPAQKARKKESEVNRLGIP